MSGEMVDVRGRWITEVGIEVVPRSLFGRWCLQRIMGVAWPGLVKVASCLSQSASDGAQCGRDLEVRGEGAGPAVYTQRYPAINQQPG